MAVAQATERGSTSNGAPLVSARGLTKHYGGITAADAVDLDIGRGEIVALVGDNGAGKSTVVKMIAGAVAPDEGEIRLEGEVATLRSPIDARRRGIETIYQDLAMPPNLDVVTNIYLGRERRRRGMLGVLGAIDRRQMRREADSYLRDLKISIPRTSGVPVESLSGGQRQSVAIARAMVWASKLLIMDEPTAALGVEQSAAVLGMVRRLRERGISIVIISHILPHVLGLADRIVVMRHGRKVADRPAQALDEHTLIELIVGMRAGDFGTNDRPHEEAQ